MGVGLESAVEKLTFKQALERERAVLIGRGEMHCVCTCMCQLGPNAVRVWAHEMRVELTGWSPWMYKVGQ